MNTIYQADRTTRFTDICIKSLLVCLIISIPVAVSGAKTDTISFFSEVFDVHRTIYVHQPSSFKYKSDAVKYPVIYVLDGQHDWFVNPILSDLEYLQYTHEIPQALVVVIPHYDRIKECQIEQVNEALTLDHFLTEEVDRFLAEEYQAGEYRMIIGHSFSASFALHSTLVYPGFYSAVIAHSPFDQLEKIIAECINNPEFDPKNISISIGSRTTGKDEHHRKNYDRLKNLFPSFFNSIYTFEADLAAHNAVPVVTTPHLLLHAFDGFRSRFDAVARVDEHYKMTDKAGTVDEEMRLIHDASRLSQVFYPPEIADINGIASRYYYSSYPDHVKAVYETGIAFYPNYYEFYLALYEQVASSDTALAISYLQEAEKRLTTVECNWAGKNDILEEIQAEMKKLAGIRE